MMSRRTLLAAAGLIATPAVLRAQDARTLRIGSALDPQHPIIIGARRMADRLEELSGGRLKAAIFPSSQLGAQREMWQNVQAGVLDGVIDASANMVNFVGQFGVLDLPYLVPDSAAAFRLLDGPVAETELVNRAAGSGFRVVNFWEVTFRNIYTRRPVNQMADLRGLKIRVIPNPSFIALFRALGAAPTPMAFGEIYTALQQGVIDGAENDNVTYLSSRHAEVARNLAITNHMMLVNTFVMSERQFTRLSADQRGWIREASLVGRAAVTAEREGREQRALADIAAAGVTITRPDLAPFIEAGRRTYEQSEERLGRDLVARFAAAARA
ncbi:TRAP transporter substrate-binding protein [Falsiroseomonas oryzae]|uniref:TRAP transporter substrate-binding protein n=1 Tax=Falsiroseomonas oryzae TaxID=2766473 RepID=UPI0022EA2749|nr:TRAP transporter substrate-binding protein [Roseomonas sp. MO-31]